MVFTIESKLMRIIIFVLYFILNKYPINDILRRREELSLKTKNVFLISNFALYE